jgi:hypothetical protein
MQFHAQLEDDLCALAQQPPTDLPRPCNRAAASAAHGVDGIDDA